MEDSSKVQVSPIIALGNKRPVVAGDFLPLPHEDESRYIGDKLEKYWQEETKRPNPSIVRAFLRAFWPMMVFITLGLGLECVVQLVSPYMLSQVVLGMQSGASSETLYLYAMGLSLSILV